MVTEEELSQMTPEQLSEFQKQNCVFCQIASGRVPAKAVYDDERVIAVLDIRPAAPGHMLLLPKGHYSVMPQLPDDLAAHLFMVAKGLSQAVLKSLKSRGTTIFAANGVAAGQKAPHFMLHIIPRNDGDGVGLGVPAGEAKQKETSAIREALKKALGTGEEEAEIVREEKKGESEGKRKKPQKREAGRKEFDLDAVTRVLGGKDA